MPEQARKLLANFSSEDRVLVIITADPDSMASALAFKRLLWRRAACVMIARSNEISRPDNLAMVRLLNIPMEPLSGVNLSNYNKIVMVDSQPHHNVSFDGIKPNVVIDHHPMGESTQQLDFFDVRPRYGANSSIMTEYLRGARIKPSTRLATALVYGIKNDTANFQRPCLEEDVTAFQFLFPKANNSVLRKIELSEMRVRDMDILRRALEASAMRKRTMFAHLGPVKSPDNLVQIADFFLRIDSVDMSAVSGTYQDKLIVILRSAMIRQSAGAVAGQAFGQLGSAGGHKAMARAEIPLDEVVEYAGGTDDQSLKRFVMRRVQRPSAALRKSPLRNNNGDKQA